MASISLPSPKTTFLQTLFTHQFLPSDKPVLDSQSLNGRTAVITGASGGIGLECARLMLSLQLSHLIIAVRSPEKGTKAVQLLHDLYPNAKIEFWHLDLNSYESIQHFARKCASLSPLDIAILNAAIMNSTFSANPSTGHEETFQVNYLSTALLAILLVPILKANPRDAPGRLTLVSSVAAMTTPVPEKDFAPIVPSFDIKEGWSSSVAKQRYDVTKLLLLMFMLKLSRLVRADDVIINAVDPGFTIGTDLFRSISTVVKIAIWPLAKLIATSPEKGAWTYIDACVARGVESHGSFLSDWKINAFHPIMYTSEGRLLMDRLWEETIKEYNSDEVCKIVKSL